MPPSHQKASAPVQPLQRGGQIAVEFAPEPRRSMPSIAASSRAKPLQTRAEGAVGCSACAAVAVGFVSATRRRCGGECGEVAGGRTRAGHGGDGITRVAGRRRRCAATDFRGVLGALGQRLQLWRKLALVRTDLGELRCGHRIGLLAGVDGKPACSRSARRDAPPPCSGARRRRNIPGLRPRASRCRA